MPTLDRRDFLQTSLAAAGSAALAAQAANLHADEPARPKLKKAVKFGMRG